MKYLKTYQIFERYPYIDDIELSEYESDLEKIEQAFSVLPKEDIKEIVMDLEDIGVKFFNEILMSVLWKGEELIPSRATTSTGEIFRYYKTKDYYNNSENIFSKKTIKTINAEIINDITNSKPRHEIEQLWSNDFVKKHFRDTIIEEAKSFSALIAEGWIPCFAVAKLSKIGRNWELNNKVIDAFFEFREKISNLCGYEIVFFPNSGEPSLVIIDKKYIHS